MANHHAARERRQMKSRKGRANESQERAPWRKEKEAERHRVRNSRSIWRRNKVVEGQTRMREPYCEQERMGWVAVRHGGGGFAPYVSCFSLEY